MKFSLRKLELWNVSDWLFEILVLHREMQHKNFKVPVRKVPKIRQPEKNFKVPVRKVNKIRQPVPFYASHARGGINFEGIAIELILGNTWCFPSSPSTGYSFATPLINLFLFSALLTQLQTPLCQHKLLSKF